jgi:hypothetical protein
MLNGAQQLETRLKAEKKRQEIKDKEAILLDIKRSQTKKKCAKIYKTIHQNNEYVELDKLRAATWNGIPETIPALRCDSWKLLLDYTPIDTGQLDSTLERKRQEYYSIVKNYFGDFQNSSVENLVPHDGKSSKSNVVNLSEFEKKNFKQIKIDVLRTQPDI